ncbi:MAG: Tc toxin subunit A, partial [Vicinamibacterales bacterium]
MDKRSRGAGKAKKQPGKRPPTTPGAAARRTAGATLTARGVVRAPDGRPLAGLLVRAYDKNLRSEDSLGESVTDAEGRYEIRYRSTQPKQAPKGHADLRIAVCDPAGEEIATSDVHFNAPADVVIDVTVPAAGRGPSEYERHLDALKPAQQGLSLAELTEDAEHQDVTFLTGETGIERDHIKCLVRAARAAAARPSLPAATARTALPTEIFYGLFRQGLPTSLDELWTEPVDALITALRLSIEQNIIPSAISAQIPVARQYFELARAAHLLQPIVNGPASLGDVLRAIPGKEQLTPAEQLEFARLYDAHGSTEHLWAAVAGTALAAKRPALERTFELRALTQSHPAIIDALHRTHDAGASASIAYLASLSSAEWLDLAFTHGAPPGSDQPPVEYAAQLERAVERRFSTAVLRERLASGVVRMRSVDAAPLVAFLTEHPDFDLRTHDAGEYLDAAGIASPPLRTSLTRLQRVLPLAGSIQATAALLDEGFASASHIAAAGSDMLRARLGPAIDEPTLGDIYHAAEERADTIGALGTVLRSYIGTNTSVLPAAKLGPTLRTLFGDLDFCECRHCQSVLGPAAYLADLLHFLETSPASNGGTAFDALRQRRPDLADLELSCENTNIEIPYIDLVLEILENEVALPVAIPLTASATPDFEAELTAGRVPPAIRAALAKTATTVGDVFTVRRAPQSLLLTVPRRSEWTLSDGSRRWRVAYQSRQLVAWREVAPGFNVPRFLPSLPALDAIETELAAGTLHPDLLHALA